MTQAPPTSRTADQTATIGFLFNHDQIHQIGHSLPIALAMAEHEPSVEVVVATTSRRLADEVARLSLGRSAAARIRFVELELKSAGSRLAARLLDWLLPAAKLAVYRDNLDFFRSLDVLLVTEKTSLLLKTRYRLTGLRMAHTRHGAGDRAIGFDPASAGFDQVLVSGPKVRDRLIAEAGVAPGSIDMVGYPKFDWISEGPALPFTSSARPTILYNPHSSPHLSSWYKDGRRVLDWFLGHPEFNLIFAPHVMLFERPFTLTIDRLRVERSGRIARKYHEAPNILIDLGSSASTDMSYTNAADLYLGDASSQVYEFLFRPRPCIFLDSHHVDHFGDPNFAHWRAGEVIGDVAELGRAIDRALANPDRYRAAQGALFEQSFDLTDELSARRAARAIVARL